MSQFAHPGDDRKTFSLPAHRSGRVRLSSAEIKEAERAPGFTLFAFQAGVFPVFYRGSSDLIRPASIFTG